MLTRMMKRVSVGALLLAVVFWSYAPPYALALRFLIGLSAVMVAIQAVRARKYYWAAGFYAVAAIFNPFMAWITLQGSVSVIAVLAAVVLFAVSLTALRTQPLLSMPSITERAARRESL